MEEVHTPDVRTIEELAAFMNVPTAKTLKTVLYVADEEVVFVAIRGDLEINEVKLKNCLGVSNLRLATPEEVNKAGIISGSASPVGMEGFQKVCDDSVRTTNNFIAGANKKDYIISLLQVTGGTLTVNLLEDLLRMAFFNLP